ncbi:TPA: hypothetical protein ACH3X1_005840 [Trebouxia sp. C0004]
MTSKGLPSTLTGNIVRGVHHAVKISNDSLSHQMRRLITWAQNRSNRLESSLAWLEFLGVVARAGERGSRARNAEAKQYDAFALLSNRSIGFTSAVRDRPLSDKNMLHAASTEGNTIGRTNFRARNPPASPCSCAALARDIKQQHSVGKAVGTLVLADQCKDRRTALLSSLTVLTGSFLVSKDAQAIPLAPLGRNSDTIGGPKLQQPSLKQVQGILAKDLADGQYFVTGNLTPEIFADDCRFVDPTNDVTGLSRYHKALTILFDPAQSEVKLKQIRVSGPATVEADWTLGGVLKLPWQPRIQTISGHTVYTVNEAGLIQKQEQQWSITAWTALRQSFTPSFGQ